MLRQQHVSAGYIPHQQLGLLRVKLAKAGYETHDGPAVQRDREVATLRKVFESNDGRRQNHVQLVQRGRTVAVYAHTEPHVDRFVDHALSAVFDGASFSGGSRMVRNDLENQGFTLLDYREALAEAR